MASSRISRTRQWALALAGSLPFLGLGQTAFVPQADEYSVTRGLPGDQTHPWAAANSNGGYVVWQDNATDGDGLGISACALNNSFSPVPQRTFRVNQQGAGDQNNPRVALLDGGGAVFVWQGGASGAQHIFARYLKPDGTFLTTADVAISSFTPGPQSDPAVAVLPGNSVVVVWSSLNQDGSMLGVFGQRLSAAGEKLGGEFAVNQFTTYNQRSAAIAALSGGRFVVTWVSEQQRFPNSVDIYARLYDANASPLGGEFVVNTGTNTCANPAVSVETGGNFLLAWSERDLAVLANGWNVLARRFDAYGEALGDSFIVNQTLRGNQFGPRPSTIGATHLVVWTSEGQDGSREGVFGRFVTDGQLAGGEFLVNTTTVSQQLHPVVANDGAGRFVVLWASFMGAPYNFELLAQRYSPDQSLPAPAAPFIAALDQYRLSVSWPELAGYSVAHYALYLDGSPTPVTTTNIFYFATGLMPGTTHQVSLAYALSDGRQSPVSPAASGRTWGVDANYDGLPDDWVATYFGTDPSKWPSPQADSDGDGVSNLREFLAGTDPTDPKSALRTSVVSTSQGLRLNWDTQPGFVYQVQYSTDLAAWTDLAGPRFAPGTADSIPVTQVQSTGYFRIIRLR